MSTSATTASATPTANPMLTGLAGPSPAYQVALDMLKRGAIVGPLLVAVGAAVWGGAGAGAVAYGLALVLLNFWLSAAIIAYAARISLALLMAGVMFGFLVRLGLIFVAVWLVRDAGWVDMFALGVTIIVTHLGLLAWELKYVSASLAYPGLKPKKGQVADSLTSASLTSDNDARKISDSSTADNTTAESYTPDSLTLDTLQETKTKETIIP